MDSLKLEAQSVVDQLLKRNLIPFKLTIAKVECVEDSDIYTIYFPHSRLHSVTVSWVEGESFRNACDLPFWPA